MAISPLATKRFLERKLNDSSKAKRFTTKALRRKIKRLDPVPEFNLKPYRHQLVCFLLGLRYPGYVFLLDMGLGKSAIALNLFRYRKQAKQAKRMLVLVPFRSNVGGWLKEVQRHADELRVVGLSGDVGREERFALLDSRPDIAIATYQGWAALVCKKHNNAMIVDSEKADHYESLFDTVVFDESSFLRNNQSLSFKLAKRLAASCSYRYALTGTPFNKDPEEMWPQFYLVDGGETLGPTLGLFRAAFMRNEPTYWKKYNWVFKRRMHGTLNRMIRHRSVRYSEDECLDLPQKIGGMKRPMVRSVVLPKSTWSYYDAILEDIRTSRGNREIIGNAYIRARMVESGFLPVETDLGDRHEVVFPENPKLDWLSELLEEIGPDEKVIVFHVYRKTGQLIEDRLMSTGISCVRLYGGTRGKQNVIDSFVNGKKRILIASKAGAYGLNLQVARHTAFFERPDDPMTSLQAEKRNHRAGQRRRVHIHDVVCKGGVSERILLSLQNGKRFFDQLVDGKADL